MGLTVAVTGLKELAAKVREFKELGLPAALRAANKAGAELIAIPAKANAPVGAGLDPHPGRLAGTVRATATLTAGYVKVGNASTPYALAIHWGWPKHHIKKNPFAQKALEVNRDGVTNAYADAINDLVAQFHSEG